MIGTDDINYGGIIMEENYASKRDLEELRSEMHEGFEKVDKRFEQVDKRFEQVDKRFEQVDKRFEQVDKRFGQVDKRLEQVDKKLEQADKKLDEQYKIIQRTAVLLEKVQSDVQQIAEGVINTGKLSKKQDNHEDRITTVEWRVDLHEKVIKEMS